MRLRFVLTLFLLSTSLFGQRVDPSHQLGFFLGGSNFIGDVGNYGIHLPQGYALGLTYRHQFNHHYAVRGQFTYGMVSNDDNLSSWDSRHFRNLHFRSPVFEGIVAFEVNYFTFIPGSNRYNHTPYMFGGAGIATFNPQAYYDESWHDLQPLGTEGQRTSVNPDNFYSLSAWLLTFGMGYRWNISDSWNVALEIGFRRTSTDYLDDVSGNYASPQILREERGELAAILSNRTPHPEDLTGYARGNNQTKDWYVFTGVHLQFQLTPFIERCANFISN